jgi:thioredoxin 1
LSPWFAKAKTKFVPSKSQQGMETEKKETFNDIINSGQTVLVDFFAEWCGPCKMMQPILKELSGMVAEDVRIIKIDVDRNPMVSSAFQIRGVPTLMIFKNGQVKWRQSGVLRAPELKRILEGIA